MCTLAAWFSSARESRSDRALVVFANRDERLDRPSLPPRLEAGPPRILLPVDAQEGGTWLGLNQHGLFVGVTNRAGAARDPSRRSRGALVREALGSTSAVELRDRLEGVGQGVHNPFHLLYADRDRAFLTWDDGDGVHHADVEAPMTGDGGGAAVGDGESGRGAGSGGLVVVTERGHAWDAARLPGERDAFVRRAWDRLTAEQREDPAALIGLLAQHGESPLDGACVHADALGYGTRSSFAMVLSREPGASRAVWVEGKPCTTPSTDLAPLLAGLL